jgi:2-pyrone-4,6-dicarboxylate lactonase
LIWGSDSPHPRVEGEMTDAGHLFELQKWTPDDKARQRILVKKPARFYRCTD